VIDTGPFSALLSEHPRARRWIVAYSGGMDSHVLLELCRRFLQARPPGAPVLEALHVDHGVHPEAARWAAHCESVGAGLGVTVHVRRVALGPDARSEEQLRRARYRAFEAFCGEDDLLLLAHHRNDQAETVLLRLLRGAGPSGLIGMPRTRPCGAAMLSRPLLEQPREALREFAEGAGLEWIDDPANAAADYARNFLRHRVLPVIEQRWPGSDVRIVRAASHCAEAASICAEVATADLARCRRVDRFGQSCLDLAAWRQLGAERGRNLLREWLREQGAERVEAQAMETLLGEVIEAAADRQPRLVLGRRVVRRHADALYVLPRRAERGAPPAAFVIEPGYSCEVPRVGRIALLPERGGVRPGRRYEVGFRRAGLSCRLAGRPEKSLKQILQEAEVPPWLRERVPLLFVDGTLAAVGDIGIAAECLAAPDEEGVRLAWTPETSPTT